MSADERPEGCWIPEGLAEHDDPPSLQWVDIGSVRFTDPFFDGTLARRRRDRPAVRTSPVRHLLTAAAAVDAPPPTAFIFHVSRCGSTLLAQLFGGDPDAIVLSEAPILDQLLRCSLADRANLFSAALRVLGQRRTGTEARLLVKTDCWHLFSAETIRALFPHVPFILLYRDPDAVLGSHQRARGMHLVPGLVERLPMPVDWDPAVTTLDQHGAAVLERYYAAMAAVAAADPRTLLVNYHEGFPAVFWRIRAWLGLPTDSRLRAWVDDRCAFDAKNPGVGFSRSAAASSGVDMSRVRRHYDRLEQLRQSPGR